MIELSTSPQPQRRLNSSTDVSAPRSHAVTEQVAPLRLVGVPRGGNRLDRGLHSLVAKSMVHIAEAEPDAL